MSTDHDALVEKFFVLSEEFFDKVIMCKNRRVIEKHLRTVLRKSANKSGNDIAEEIRTWNQKRIAELEADNKRLREALGKLVPMHEDAIRALAYNEFTNHEDVAKREIRGNRVLTIAREALAGQKPKPKGEEMSKFRKKPVVIEAHQWFKNGDHPEDNCKTVYPDIGPLLSEGKVVRRYHRPDIDGQRECGHCGKKMDDHGWIDTLEAGHNVCPGDWIITGVKGERYPCKPEIFEETYDLVSDISGEELVEIDGDGNIVPRR